MLLSLLKGRVEHGRGKGTGAGIPTANIAVDTTVLPPPGVYATHVYVRQNIYVGVTNIGTRPTADSEERWTVETLVLDFEGDLYGEEMCLQITGYIRAIQKFPDMHALAAQIAVDARAAREMALPEEIISFITHAATETADLGTRLAAQLAPRDVVVLDGQMGAGKSELARGIARGLHVAGAVPSPSYTILNQYDCGRLKLNHFDWYRTSSEDELYEMGADEQIKGDNITLIEWAQRGASLLPKDYLLVRITPIDEDTRFIALISRGGYRRLDAHALKEKEEC